MFLPGQKIHKNTIIKSMGGGNFGEVFSSTHEDYPYSVAIKFCKPLTLEEDKERFIQENKILHNLKTHKNIILPLSEIEKESDHVFYLMELADFNLKDYIADRYVTITLNDQINLFREICVGLQYAHEKGVIHRDLYWNNVLIKIKDSIPEIKLNDFGRSKDFNLDQLDYDGGPRWGIRLVQPPELLFDIFNESTKDSYVLGDIYALGILLSFILSTSPDVYYLELELGIKKFKKGKNFDQMTTQEKENEYVEWLKETSAFDSLNISIPDQNLNREINFIIQKMSHVDYRKRYSNVKDILDDLDKLKI